MREAVCMHIEVHIEAFSAHPQGTELYAVHPTSWPLAALEHVLTSGNGKFFFKQVSHCFQI